MHSLSLDILGEPTCIPLTGATTPTKQSFLENQVDHVFL